ncbi:MAG TPA: carbon storage regulator CsrA [Bacilli bacterium]|nr:carbon storage regulator CsrA [Bacilli bacterium]
MLVLKRRIGEALIIGDDIEIVLLEKDGDTVKVGIEAPKSVRVYRKEIYEEIRAANRSALQATDLSRLRRQFLAQMKKGEN